MIKLTNLSSFYYAYDNGYLRKHYNFVSITADRYASAAHVQAIAAQAQAESAKVQSDTAKVQAENIRLMIEMLNRKQA